MSSTTSTTSTSTTTSTDFKTICNKEQVSLLKQSNNEPTYNINFNVHNPNFPIFTVIGSKMYTLLYELNRDIIHSFQIIKENDEDSNKSIEMIFLFKSYGRDFGLAPKFMHTVSTIKSNQQCCTFNSIDVDTININNAVNNNHSIPKKYEKIHTNHSILNVHFISNNDLHFNFTFSLKDNTIKENEYPIYMENSVALMIKKMFCRLKVFTERMT